LPFSRKFYILFDTFIFVLRGTVGLSISYGTIRRRYEQGLDSIVRLVIQLEDRIEELMAMHVSAPQISIQRLTNHIKQLKQTLANKDTELIQSHQLNVQLQARIRELEKSLEEGAVVEPEPVVKRDSHNSNQPPSLDLPWVKPKRTRSLRKKSGLKVGGQPGHPGTTLPPVATPNRIIEHVTNDCCHCGAPLASVDPSRFFRRQVFEIEDGSLAVVEHRASHKCCPECGNLSKGQFPAAVKAPVQYGASVMSRALYLHLYQLLPIARTQEAMRDLFGCSISQASIQRAARLCSYKLIGCEQRIKAAIRDSAVIGADETSIRINGANAWVHVARTEQLTHLASHTHRGQAAFNAIGILNGFKGTLVRDGWFSYKWYQQCKHSLCNAHLLRDLTYIGEAEPDHEPWTTALAKLLIEIKDAVETARNSSLSELDSERHKDFLSRYDALIVKGEEAVRGSPAQKSTALTAGKLLNRLIRNKPEVLRFMTDFAVPFDNNGSERDLRMLKLQQKIAGCFRTSEGVTTFCRVRSYLSSARKQGRSLLIALERALNAKPVALTT
jgi:transposase